MNPVNGSGFLCAVSVKQAAAASTAIERKEKVFYEHPAKASLPVIEASSQILPLSALSAGKTASTAFLPRAGCSDGHHCIAGTTGLQLHRRDENGRQGIGYSVRRFSGKCSSGILISMRLFMAHDLQ